MITIKEIIEDAIKEKESNVYYWDSLYNHGYMIHINNDFTFCCFKSTKNFMYVISADEFERAVNCRCYCNSIGEDNFYWSFK